jgi:nucleoside 2-deoxyribosyltransferase
MKIYLAAMYQWMDKMKIEREKYRAAGFEITADWIESDEVNQARSHNENATLDLAGIDNADVFVLYTLPVGTMFSSGGRMTELGYAIALNKRIIIVGERENVFCHLDNIVEFSTTEDVIAHLLYLIQRKIEYANLMVAPSDYMPRSMGGSGGDTVLMDKAGNIIRD